MQQKSNFKNVIIVLLLIIIAGGGFYLQQVSASNMEMRDFGFKNTDNGLVISKVKGGKVDIVEKDGKKFLKAPGVIIGDGIAKINGENIQVETDYKGNVRLFKIGNDKVNIKANNGKISIVTEKGKIKLDSEGVDVDFDFDGVKFKSGKDGYGVNLGKDGNIGIDKDGNASLEVEGMKLGVDKDRTPNVNVPGFIQYDKNGVKLEEVDEVMNEISNDVSNDLDF